MIVFVRKTKRNSLGAEAGSRGREEWYLFENLPAAEGEVPLSLVGAPVGGDEEAAVLLAERDEVLAADGHGAVKLE